MGSDLTCQRFGERRSRGGKWRKTYISKYTLEMRNGSTVHHVIAV